MYNQTLLSQVRIHGYWKEFVKLSGFALNLSGSDSSAKKKKKFIRRVYKISFF
jgi:hypothetical protein